MVCPSFGGGARRFGVGAGTRDFGAGFGAGYRVLELLRGLAGREAFGAATELLAVVGRIVALQIGRGI